MRLQDLKGCSREEQHSRIASQPAVDTMIFLEEPIPGKQLAFFGNYEGFFTEGLCVRTLTYVEAKGKWQVADMDLSDMYSDGFDHLFSVQEVQEKFAEICNLNGFLLDK